MSSSIDTVVVQVESKHILTKRDLEPLTGRDGYIFQALLKNGFVAPDGRVLVPFSRQEIRSNKDHKYSLTVIHRRLPKIPIYHF
jgi:hypothetical protein